MIFLISTCANDTTPRTDAGWVENDAPATGAVSDGRVADFSSRRVATDTGFTLTEMLMVIAIIGVVAAIAIPMYSDRQEKTKRNQAITDITFIQTTIDQYALENRYQYPDSLADVKMDTMRDPWKGPYQYTRLDNAKGKGSARKDKNLVPINTDYDLWSNGQDGKSVAPLTAQASRDDIVRANNGRFVGPAADY